MLPGPPVWLALAIQVGSEPQTETYVRMPRAERPRTDTLTDAVVVTAEQLAATGERSLPRQLAKAAGVWVQETNLGGGSPILQGLSGAQVLLLVDGVRMNDATTRNGVNQMLNGIEPATVDRIEVLRGPRSVLYGSDALGGVVLVWTKRSTPHGDAPDLAPSPRVALDAQYESASNGASGAVTAADALERNAWLFVGGYHEWNELHTADGEVDHTGYGGGSLFGAWETALSVNSSLRATASYTRDVDVPRTDRLNAGFGQTNPSNSEFDYALQDRRRFVLAYDDRHAGALADHVQVRLSLRQYEEERQIRNFNSSTRRYETDDTNTIGLGVDFKKSLGARHLLTYGFDVDHDDVDAARTDRNIVTGVETPNSGAFAPGSRYTSMGAFVQDEIALGDAWDLTAGTRYNQFFFHFDDPAGDEDGDFGALSGSLAAGRELAEGVRFVGTIASGFRAPNLSELARDATFASGVELRNPDLDPERSLYAELALDRRGARWDGGLALFVQRIDDVVGRVLVDEGAPGPGDETFLRQNIGRVDLAGVQARGRAVIGPETSPWSATAGVEYVCGEQHDDYVDPDTGEAPFDGEPAQRIPPLHGWVGFRYEAESWIDWVELTTSWALAQDRLSPQDLDDPRIDPSGTDGWVTLDLDVGGPIGDATSSSSWRIGLHNLLDEEYRIHGSGLDGPGFGVVVGLRVSN